MRFEVINGRGEADRAGDVRRAGLEPVGRFFERAFFQSDADDHFAAAVPGRHRFQNFGAAVERADPGRSTHLVAGEGQEIAAQLLDIDRQMSGALRRIDQRDGADRARFLGKARPRD